MRLQVLAAVFAAGMFTGTAHAQAPAVSPTLELRLRSVNDFLDKSEYVGGLLGKDDLVKGVKGLLKAMMSKEKGLEGIDPNKPFGLYATLSVDVVNSPVAFMVPIADQEQFLKLLKDRLGLTTEKAEAGALKMFVPLPVVNELYLRFANDYLYIGRTVKELDPKTLIAPKAFFAGNDAAIGSLIVRFDQIPTEVKKFVIGQFEMTAADQRKRNGMNEGPGEKAFLDWFGDALTGGLKTFLEDARVLTVRFVIDEKSEELVAEASLTAKPGSTLAKNLASYSGQTSLPAGIVAATKPAITASAKGGLTPELKKRFAKVVDEVGKALAEKVDPNAKATVEQAFEALAPTFKAAEVDSAMALVGPNAKGFHTLILAGAVKEGKKIESLLKDLSKFAGGVADFDFDVDKIGDYKLHKITLNDGPPELEKFFGTKTFWLAASDSAIALSIEPDGAVIKAGLKARAIPVPMLSIQVSAASLVPLIGADLKPDEKKALMKDVFGPGETIGKDAISITIAGGEQLTIKARIQGKAMRLIAGIVELKK